MTQETLDKLERLQCQLYDAKRRRGWMEDWGEELYRPDNLPEAPDKFRVTITRNDYKAVLQREISREDAEAEYLAELQELDARIAEIEKEIANL